MGPRMVARIGMIGNEHNFSGAHDFATRGTLFNWTASAFACCCPIFCRRHSTASRFFSHKNAFSFVDV
jgi:hypothetical protein